MSATDTSQSSSGFLRSQRTNGETELHSWTQGLGGAPRPNPVVPSQGAPQAFPSSAGPSSAPGPSLGPSMATTRYSSSNPNSGLNPNTRFDQKPSPAFQPNGINPFLSSPSLGLGVGTDTHRPEGRSGVREAWSQTQAPDTQNFDLSTYTHAQARPSAFPASNSAFPASKESPVKMSDQSASLKSYATQQGYNDWGHQSGASQEKTSFQTGFNLHAGTEPPSGSADFDEFDTEGMTGADEPRFANKKILISVVLIGALIFGSGISYVYNSFFGGSSDGPTPLVKNAQGPAKVKPSDPGGKQFAHSDSKILGRLDDTQAAAQPDPNADPSAGSKKVSTLDVSRDGSIQSPTSSDTQSSSSVSVPVPGMTLIESGAQSGKVSTAGSGEGKNPPPSSSAVAAKEEILPAESLQKTDTKTAEVVNKKEPKQVSPQTSNVSADTSASSTAPSAAEVAGAIPASASSPASSSSPAGTKIIDGSAKVGAVDAIPSPGEGSPKSTLKESDLSDPSLKKPSSLGSSVDAAAPASPAMKKTEVKTAAIVPTSRGGAPTSVQPSGLGFVAVLASVPVSGSSRITALQKYADLQQKYSGILQSKIPDVQQVNLGAKGSYHRLIIGPPGSKEGASTVCSQLKAAGYSDCWIMAF